MRNCFLYVALLLLHVHSYAQGTCSAAVELNTGNSFTQTSNVSNATADFTGECGGGTVRYDVWYRFIAQTTIATISLTGIGTTLAAQNPRMELRSGTCPTPTTVLVCAGTSNRFTVKDLVIGTTYLIRIYSTTGTGNGPTNQSGFTISLNQIFPTSSRMYEVWQSSIVSGASVLNNPWDVTFGPDGFLWVTEAKGYRVKRIHPSTYTAATVLDLNNAATGYLTATQHTALNKQSNMAGKDPQGGLAGLAIHPEFATNPAKRWVYISYVYRWNNADIANDGGIFYTNRIVRFTYNTVSNKLESPSVLCDTLPGSSDHNSQRMIIAPEGGVNYLYYAAGDMGAGQFGNARRPIKAQFIPAYEGKILRFNLEEDTDADAVDKWIPNTNPFNGTVATNNKQSAVWALGIRNNQGFAYANGKLYGSSHGAYSDDEINVLEATKNYGHPWVQGFAGDDNYNGSKAGHKSGSNNTIMPLISDESNNVGSLPNYQDPIFSAYAAPQATINNIWSRADDNTPGNEVDYIQWPSEGWSGLDHYNYPNIPGWKNSLLVAALKWGRTVRLKLNTAGTAIIPTAGADTVMYFQSANKYRDIAFDTDGRTMYLVMNNDAASSGPSNGSPLVPACPGCLMKYTFLGYNNTLDNRSTIPTAIDVDAGQTNTCVDGTEVTIDATNNNLWVPITGPDGNIVAEIKANGNNLGLVQSSFYVKTGAHREDVAQRLYLNRNITITPTVQPSSAVDVRLYVTKAELDALIAARNSSNVLSGVTGIGNLAVFKNNDPCQSNISRGAPKITTTYAEAHGANAFVLNASVTSFSTFYFGNNSFTILPAELISFEGKWNNSTAQLEWLTTSDEQATGYTVERSVRQNDGYAAIGYVPAKQQSGTTVKYNFDDADAANQPGDDVFYRLKLHATDGSFAYSKTVQLRKPGIGLQLYPNPVEDVLNINLGVANSGRVTVQVTDAQGRVLYQQAMRSGNGRLEVNMKGWAAQLYAVTVLNAAGEVLTTKTVLKK